MPYLCRNKKSVEFWQSSAKLLTPYELAVPRLSSWRSRVSPILDTLRALEQQSLTRSHIESIFGLQRRAALRLMAPFVADQKQSVWQADRLQMIAWLEMTEREVDEEQHRHQRVLQALNQIEAENRSLREALRRRGPSDPPHWTLKQDVFSRTISSLPPEIRLGPGEVTVRFPPEDPADGARLLHELALAMVNDWVTFCRFVGVDQELSPEQVLDNVLGDLEAQRRSRL